MGGRKRRSRGHIETRPNGSFRAIAYAGMDPLTGKQRYLRKTAATYNQAEVELTKLLSQIDDQRQPRSSINIGTLVDKWLDVAELEDTTRQRYEGLIRLYIRPTFGSLPAGRLDAELLERFYARLRRCNKLCTGPTKGHECRPLSASSVRQIHFILRAAFDRGVRWRYLSLNEVALAEPPAFERPEPDPPPAEEVAAVLNEAWHDPGWGLLLWLTMVSGCRRGEICALRWTDLDLDREIMTVERSYSQTAKQRREKSTKARQKRRLALDAYTVELLTAYRAQCEADCVALGLKLPRDAFVFSGSPDGSTATLPDTVTQKYRRLAIRLGLRSTRLHALRHYSATELLTAGVDLRTVAGRLGHGSGGATTLRSTPHGSPRLTIAPPRQSAISYQGRTPRLDRLGIRTTCSPSSCAAPSRPVSCLPAHRYPPAANSPLNTTRPSALSTALSASCERLDSSWPHGAVARPSPSAQRRFDLN